MANREELGIIRAARAGQAGAQLALGKLYLFGSAGLPKSLPTALHWLDRAAQQECAAACELIGTYIPLDLARQSGLPLAARYERAYEQGVAGAGLVLAQLVLLHGEAPALRAKALCALEGAAGAGLAEARSLLALQRAGAAPPAADPEPDAAARAPSEARQRQAADGAAGAFSVLDQAWEAGRWESYVQRALPLARALVQAAGGSQPPRVAPEDVRLVSRCARLLAGVQPGHAPTGPADPDELRGLWELAAAWHDRHAQFAVGLRCARMEVDGKRVAAGTGAANFKKAIRWLTLAGEQGMAEAWYALSRIYVKPEFSQRNVADAQKYLERAAGMGLRDAQRECGNNAWRARRENENNDVRALYWLQQAAAQGCTQAAAALRKIAPRSTAPAYTDTGALAPRHGQAARHPLLAARLELAAIFSLSRAEALLLEVAAADRGHCLVIDIRASYGRSRRRLVLVDTAQERQALDRIVRLFDNVDGGPAGPEGNYRQRLYRLRTLVPEPAAAGPDQRYDLAA